jgi:hypothetical protein
VVDLPESTCPAAQQPDHVREQPTRHPGCPAAVLRGWLAAVRGQRPAKRPCGGWLYRKARCSPQMTMERCSLPSAIVPAGREGTGVSRGITATGSGWWLAAALRWGRGRPCMDGPMRPHPSWAQWRGPNRPGTPGLAVGDSVLLWLPCLLHACCAARLLRWPPDTPPCLVPTKMRPSARTGTASSRTWTLLRSANRKREFATAVVARVAHQ